MLDSNVLALRVGDTYEQEHFDPDSFQCTDFLRPVTRILYSQLEWSFPIEHDDMPLCERWIKIFDRREVKIVENRDWLLLSSLASCVLGSLLMLLDALG